MKNTETKNTPEFEAELLDGHPEVSTLMTAIEVAVDRYAEEHGGSIRKMGIEVVQVCSKDCLDIRTKITVKEIEEA